MKKISLVALFAALVAVNVHATDLVTETTHVTWTTPLHIEAAQFATAQPGQKIVVTYEAATDGIEFKVKNAHFDHLAGSREAAWIDGNGTFEQFLTQAAVDSLKLYGLELIGANFTATKVELNDGKELKDGITVWTGFFWADNWKTLELYYNAYAGVDFSKVKSIRFYSEAANGAYVLNFLKGWGEGEKFADQTNMTDGEGYKELALTDELRTAVAEAGHWMIQFNKEELDAFNVTDIVLVPTDSTTAILNTAVETKAVKIIENGQIVIIKNDIRYNALGAEIK